MAGGVSEEVGSWGWNPSCVWAGASQWTPQKSLFLLGNCPLCRFAVAQDADRSAIPQSLSHLTRPAVPAWGRLEPLDPNGVSSTFSLTFFF